MMQVDRADFSPMNPYENNPQVIPCNVVISAPLLHAYCLEKPGCKALDIRFGSGYLTVAMSKMMNDKGCEGKNSHPYLGRPSKYFPLKSDKHLHNQIGLLLNWKKSEDLWKFFLTVTSSLSRSCNITFISHI